LRQPGRTRRDPATSVRGGLEWHVEATTAGLGRSRDSPYRPLRRETPGVPDIFDLDSLLAQMVLALGAALLLGNAYALFMDRRGVKPKGQEGALRKGRAWFLFGIGAVMVWWGLGSVLVN
jgi:hypothetical protein